MLFVNISLGDGVMRTPKRRVINPSFFFFVACFNKTLLIKSFVIGQFTGLYT